MGTLRKKIYDGKINAFSSSWKLIRVTKIDICQYKAFLNIKSALPSLYCLWS